MPGLPTSFLDRSVKASQPSHVVFPLGRNAEWEELRLEVITIESAGHKIAALALAGFDAAIECSGIVFGNRYTLDLSDSERRPQEGAIDEHNNAKQKQSAGLCYKKSGRIFWG